MYSEEEISVSRSSSPPRGIRKRCRRRRKDEILKMSRSERNADKKCQNRVNSARCSNKKRIFSMCLKQNLSESRAVLEQMKVQNDKRMALIGEQFEGELIFEHRDAISSCRQVCLVEREKILQGLKNELHEIEKNRSSLRSNKQKSTNSSQKCRLRQKIKVAEMEMEMVWLEGRIEHENEYAEYLKRLDENHEISEFEQKENLTHFAVSSLISFSSTDPDAGRFNDSIFQDLPEAPHKPQDPCRASLSELSDDDDQSVNDIGANFPDIGDSSVAIDFSGKYGNSGYGPSSPGSIGNTSSHSRQAGNNASSFPRTSFAGALPAGHPPVGSFYIDIHGTYDTLTEDPRSGIFGQRGVYSSTSPARFTRTASGGLRDPRALFIDDATHTPAHYAGSHSGRTPTSKCHGSSLPPHPRTSGSSFGGLFDGPGRNLDTAYGDPSVNDSSGWDDDAGALSPTRGF